MGEIYKNQTSLRIQVDTESDLTDYSVLWIKHRKPSDAGGDTLWTGDYFVASLDGDSVNGIIYYDVGDSADLDESGTYAFWSYSKWSDGRDAPGETAYVDVKEEGS